jgi:hypothetical protein
MAQDKFEAQEKYRRKMNDLYWHQASHHDRIEANEKRATLDEYRWTEREKAVNSMAAESDELAAQRADLVGPCEISSQVPGLGVFSKPMMPGEFANAVTGGHTEGLDEYTVKMFSTLEPPQYEARKIRYWEMQSKAMKSEDKYKRLVDEKQRIVDQLIVLAQKDGLLEEQIQTVESEEEAQALYCKGPPRKDPTLRQKRSTHDRKQRLKVLVGRRVVLAKTVEDLRVRQGVVAKQVLVLGPEVQRAKEEVEAEADALNLIDMTDPHKPFVLGRSLNKLESKEKQVLPGTSLLMPQRATDVLKAASKLEILKAGAKSALGHYEAAKKVDMTTFSLNYRLSNDKAELEDMYSHMASIEDRLKKVKGDNLRRDITNAFERWHLNDESLAPVDSMPTGDCNWWAFRDRERSGACDEYGEEGGGARLGEALEGCIEGVIKLPKYSKYKITVVVTRDDAEEIELGFDTDSCVVRMGPDVEGLRVLRTCLNRKAPGKLAVYHTVTHEFVGAQLAYRFDFTADNANNTSYHLGVLPGEFEALPIPPLQEGKDGAVVSSFVLQTRAELAAGKDRSIALMEKMQFLNHTDQKLVDADVYHWGVLQRFTIPNLRALLTAEVDSIVQGSKDGKEALIAQRDAEREEQRQKRIANGEAMDEDFLTGQELEDARDKQFFDETMEDEEREKLQRQEFKKTREQRVEESEARYYKRKAKKVQANTDTRTGGLLVDKKLEIFSRQLERWRRAQVLDYRFEWLEKGTVVRKEWKVQYMGEANVLEGDPEWIDLEQLTHRVLQNDSSAAEKQRQDADVRYEAKMQQRADEEQQEIDARNAALRAVQNILSKENLQFENLRTRETNKCSQAEVAKMEKTLKTKEGKHALADRAFRIQAEFKEGRGAPGGRCTFLTKKQAESKAKEQLAQNVIKASTLKMDETWDERAKVYGEKRDRRKAELMQQVDAEAAKREQVKKRLAALEAAKLHEAQARLKRRLRIPAELFQKALPAHHACCDAAAKDPRRKPWGSKYAQGLECIHCGAHSRGTRSDYLIPVKDDCAGKKLDVHMIAHQQNESGFIPEDPEDFRRVEAERIRVEKERREVALASNRFYDTLSTKTMSELDWRHGKRSAIPFELQGCPTFRADDEIRKADFKDLLAFFGRINAFRSRKYTFGQELAALKTKRWDLVDQLRYLHPLIPKEASRLDLIEAEHMRALDTLKNQKAFDEKCDKGRINLMRMIQELERASLDRVGKVERADMHQEDHGSLVKVLHSALKHRLASAKHYHACKKSTKKLQKRTKKLTQKQEDLHQKLVELQYRRVDTEIITPYGRSKVLMYREEDDMLLTRLPFGAARLYIPLSKVVGYDQKRQQAERVAMGVAEQEGIRFYNDERTITERECPEMLAEEQLMQAVTKERELMLELERELQAVEAQARADAEDLISMVAMQETLRKDCQTQVTEAAAERKKMRKETGDKYTYPKIGLLEQRNMAHVLFEKKKVELVETLVRTARAKCVESIRVREIERRELATLGSFVDDTVAEFILEVAKESKHDSERERARAETESMVYFEFPELDIGPIQFGVYSRLLKQWNYQKLHLRDMSKTWGALGVEIRMRRALELQLAAEEERKREERKKMKMFIDAMRKEEELMRKFMREEIALALKERRAMKAEEKAMRKFMKEDALQEKQRQREANGFGTTATEERHVPTANEHARMNVKERKFEKKRLARDWAAREEEDKRSKAVEQIFRTEALKQKAEAENAIAGSGDDDDDDDDDESDDESDSDEGEEADFDSDADVGDAALLESDDDVEGEPAEIAIPENETPKQKPERAKNDQGRKDTPSEGRQTTKKAAAAS